MKVERWSGERWDFMSALFLKFPLGHGNGECRSGVNGVNRVNASVD